MTEALGTEKGERTPARLGHRSGYYGRTLVTRVGKLELRVPQDRHGRFSTELFERYQRSEKALVAALAEMYVQGVSTRKVKTITEELCGHSFSAAAISAINTRLDEDAQGRVPALRQAPGTRRDREALSPCGMRCPRSCELIRLTYGRDGTKWSFQTTGPRRCSTSLPGDVASWLGSAFERLDCARPEFGPHQTSGCEACAVYEIDATAHNSAAVYEGKPADGFA
jgi:Transposase, Mutator family